MKRGATDVCANSEFPHAHANVHDCGSPRSKRIRLSNGEGENSGIGDLAEPFGIPVLLQNIKEGNYGSVTEVLQALVERMMERFNSFMILHPDVEFTAVHAKNDPVGQLGSVSSEVVDLEISQATTPVNSSCSAVNIVILDSDEDDGDRRPLDQFEGISCPKPPIGPQTENLPFDTCSESKASEEEDERVNKPKDEGLYAGVDDDFSEEGNASPFEDDEISEIWNEMNVALVNTKGVTGDQLSDDHSPVDEGCDHSFVLKDDLGYVCRVCGVIQRAIETIFDFQYIKASRLRSYRSESRSGRENDDVGFNISGLKLSGHDFAVTEICPHPRHKKQMKPHQVEGFNFLVSNLITENPGGCILAHAPGSGKTFMIISFMQSFLALYPDARPLVVLPKGILSTWKREFIRWQVENFLLLDFYSLKADSRIQQLEVLNQWVDKRSILFLGYMQFSAIVTDNSSCKTTKSCQDILLRCPSILILDEGHTPRNEDTDVLNSLAKVHTPRKVVLSGTLYQNHVKEVFNILNLVRPKFMKLDLSRSVKTRILSRGQFSGFRKQLQGTGESIFYDLVEYTLQQDEDSKRKEAVIKDLREMTSKVLHYYKGDFLDDLPGHVDFTVLLRLSPRQKFEVEKLNKVEKRKFKRSSVGCALFTHPRLKQFSDSKSGVERYSLPSDERLDELIEKINLRDGVKAKFFFNLLMLCECVGEKLLVFSQYLLPLKFLERLTVQKKGWSVGTEIFMISGDTSAEQREIYMDHFNNSPDAKVFFGSIKACGEGISLVGASRVIILDVHLNPSVSRQAIGRAFRPGQQKKVYTYRLVAADSMEEEDHLTCFRKEQISKRWFEWDGYGGLKDFDMEAVDLGESGDLFLDSPTIAEDVKSLLKR